jgi:O-antigen ligase
MSLRHIALYILIAGLSIYAWKDWFKSLCGLILLMAVIEHEDMPKSMLGIQGLNMWNILFTVIFLAWLANRRRQGLHWDMPRHINILLLMYLGLILVGVMRAVFDRSHIEHYSLKSLISEELINTIKWALPGLLLFDGCRTRRRVIMAFVCILLLYFIVAIQVARFMPPAAVLSSAGVMDTLRIRLGKYIGYSACDISAMLAGASWAILASISMVKQKKYKVIILIAAGMVTYGQALTGGRAGYVAWGATGFILCILKWRKYLLLAPVLVILLPIIMPGAVDRFFIGFGETDITGQNTTDENLITSDRVEMWPYVIKKIGQSPIIGYGRLSMQRTGLADYLLQINPYWIFPHPHNVYLETLLDNGILGSLPIFIFWGIVLVYSGKLFRSSNRLCSALGGATLALSLAQIFAGIGAQHYYPRISTLGLWAMTFLLIRVYMEHKQTQIQSINAVNTQYERFL